MFIQTEPTPNPASLKFLPGQPVSPGDPRDFANAEEEGKASPLAEALFALTGVERVFLGADFISVTKAADIEWAHLKPAVLGAIMDHYTSGRPAVLAETDGAREMAYEGEAGEIVAQIRELIDTRIRPAVAQDGGDIVFDSWDHASGVVRLHMRGSCAGCPSSAYTLKAGIENMLKHYVPEVTAVEPVL